MFNTKNLETVSICIAVTVCFFVVCLSLLGGCYIKYRESTSEGRNANSIPDIIDSIDSSFPFGSQEKIRERLVMCVLQANAQFCTNDIALTNNVPLLLEKGE
jgi:hypothetical protein